MVTRLSRLDDSFLTFIKGRPDQKHWERIVRCDSTSAIMWKM